MRFIEIGLTLGLVALCADPPSPLAAQQREGPTRRFIIEQRSVWSSTALSGPLALVRDTLIGFEIRGDTIQAELAWEAQAELVRSIGGGKVRLRCTDPASGPSAMETCSDDIAVIGTPLLLLTAAVAPRQQTGRWVDTVSVDVEFGPTPKAEFTRAAPADSLTLRLIRRGRTTRARDGRLVSDVALAWVSRHRNTIDREMESGSTLRIWEAKGAGRLFLRHRAGSPEADSLEVKLELDGIERFRPDAGGEQVVPGHITLATKGRWVIHDEEAEAAAWWESARRGVSQAVLPISSAADSVLRERLFRGDTLLVDSLVGVRSASVSPEARAQIEGLLACGLMGCRADRVLTLESSALGTVRRHYRTGDVYLGLSILSDLQYGRNPWVDTVAAAALIDLFGTRQRQRQHGLDRKHHFAALVAAAAHVDSVGREGGRALEAVAETTDDPDVRNLFLLLAYRADPRRMLPIVRAKADTTPGYGPIVRQYAEGNPGNIGWSYGLDLIHSRYAGGSDVMKFPGFRAPLDSIARWSPSYWDAGRRREWARAHEPDAVAVLQGRLKEVVAPKERAQVAFLLLDLGDTTVIPVLRGMIREGSTGAEIYVPLEYQELLADSVRGELLADLQRQLILYAGGGVLKGEDGNALAPFLAHNERPDQHYLLRDHLLPEVIREVERGGTLTLITEEELQEVADREGIAMALYLHPPERFGSRIEASIGLGARTRPGTLCLCGGVALFGFKVDSERAAHPTSVANLIQ